MEERSRISEKKNSINPGRKNQFKLRKIIGIIYSLVHDKLQRWKLSSILSKFTFYLNSIFSNKFTFMDDTINQIRIKLLKIHSFHALLNLNLLQLQAALNLTKTNFLEFSWKQFLFSLFLSLIFPSFFCHPMGSIQINIPFPSEGKRKTFNFFLILWGKANDVCWR